MKSATLLANTIICLLLAGLMICDMAVQAIPHIDLADYPAQIDYGTLSDVERQIFDNILAAVANGQDTVACPPIPDSMRGRILTHLGLYYGNMEGISRLIHQGDGYYLALDLDLFRVYERQKIIIDARIDEACASLHPGPDWYMLLQICNYITARVDYDRNHRPTLDGMDGKGVCATYSMMFYLMASRLGYQAYICYGYVDAGYHAWNAVELGGQLYQFDVTWYDNIVHDYQYIFSPTLWGRDYILNNIFDGVKLRKEG